MSRLAVLLAAAMILGGCVASASPGGDRPGPAAAAQPAYAPEPPVHRGGTVKIGHNQFPALLAPLFPGGPAATAVENLLFAGLLGVDPALGHYPDLAVRVPTEPAGPPGIVSYQLRAGLRWSDGEPLTAQDVIYTWRLLTAPGNPLPASAEGYNRIESIESSGPEELAVHFREPYPAFASLFGTVLPQHRLKLANLAELIRDPYWARPDVVSGPFQIAELVAGSTITLVRNPHYGDGREGGGPGSHPAYLDRVVFRAYPTRSAELAALEAGELDVGLGLSEHDLPSVARMSQIRLLLASELQYEQLTFNQADPNPVTGLRPLWAGDPELRRALDLALDRPALLSGPLAGRALPASSPIGPALGWAADPALPARTYDPAQAERILNAAGWLRGADGVRVKAGRRLSFVLSTNAGNPLRAHEQELIVAGWKRVGVEARLQTVPTDTFFAAQAAGGILAGGMYEAGLWAWVLPPDPDAEFAIFHSSQVPTAANRGEGSNYSRCNDPAIDRALDDGRSGYDVARRAVAYRAFQQAYLGARCELPLFRHLDVAAVSPRLHNYRPHPAPVGDTWNAADWWRDP